MLADCHKQNEKRKKKVDSPHMQPFFFFSFDALQGGWNIDIWALLEIEYGGCVDAILLHRLRWQRPSSEYFAFIYVVAGSGDAQ